MYGRVPASLSRFHRLECTESFATPSFDIPDGLPSSPWLGVSNGLLHHPRGMVVCTVVYVFALKPLAERFVLPRGASALQNRITAMTAAWFFPFSIRPDCLYGLVRVNKVFLRGLPRDGLNGGLYCRARRRRRPSFLRHDYLYSRVPAFLPISSP